MIAYRARLGSGGAPFIDQYLFEAVHGLGEFAGMIDDHMLELGLAGHFGRGCRETTLDASFVVGLAGSNSLLYLSDRGGRNEDENGLGHQALDGGGTLHIGADEDIEAVSHGIDNLLFGHARPMAVDDGVFEKTTAFNQVIELGIGDEEVVDTVLLALSRGAGGAGNDAMELMPAGLQFVEDAVLAYARRPGKDDKERAVLVGHALLR